MSSQEFGSESLEDTASSDDCALANDGAPSDENGSPSNAGQVIWKAVRVFVVVLLVTSVATLFARQHWIADLLANLRIQQLIALSILLLLSGLFLRWKWTLPILLAIVVHSSWLFNAVPVKRSDNESADIVLTLSNVLTQNPHHDLVVADVTRHEADVIIVMELSSALARKLSDRTRESHPFSIVRPQDSGNFGIGLFSRLPVRDAEVFTLNESIESIAATINSHGADYRIIATHPLPPMSDRGFKSRNEHLRLLASKVTEIQSASPEMPIIVAGDLNVTPWSPIYEEFSDSSELHRAIDQFNVEPTWYRRENFAFGLVLDHVMVSPSIECVDHHVGPNTGSDHRSVTVKLAR